MKKLDQLKRGDVFFSVSEQRIIQYEYLMLYPFHNPKNVKTKGYHIVLDKSLDEPKRMYYTRIEEILAQNCSTYEEAKIKQIDMFEQLLDYLKNN